MPYVNSWRDFWCQLLEAEFLQCMNDLEAKAQNKNCHLAATFYNFKKEMLSLGPELSTISLDMHEFILAERIVLYLIRELEKGKQNWRRKPVLITWSGQWSFICDQHLNIGNMQPDRTCKHLLAWLFLASMKSHFLIASMNSVFRTNNAGLLWLTVQGVGGY